MTYIIDLLLYSSYEKIEKEFYYQIYFLLNHVDIYDLKNSSIKEVYRLGTEIKKFSFAFLDENGEKFIVIEDFYAFLI